MVEFNDKSRLGAAAANGKNTYESAYGLYECRKLTLNAFKSRIFPIKETDGKGLKILTPKQMLERLPIVFAQVKAGNKPKHLVNEIKKIIYS